MHSVAASFSSNKGGEASLKEGQNQLTNLGGNPIQLSGLGASVASNQLLHSVERKRDSFKLQRKYDMIHVEMKQTHFYVHRDLLTENKNS